CPPSEVQLRPIACSGSSELGSHGRCIWASGQRSGSTGSTGSPEVVVVSSPSVVSTPSVVVVSSGVVPGSVVVVVAGGSAVVPSVVGKLGSTVSPSLSVPESVVVGVGS